MLTSSTSPTVPFGVGAEAEHLAMVAAVHVLAPGGRAGDWTALRHRVRAATMAAEGVLHDLGVIADALARTRRAWAGSARSTGARSRTPTR